MAIAAALGAAGRGLLPVDAGTITHGRGGTAMTLVIEVIDSPIPSDPGPS